MGGRGGGMSQVTEARACALPSATSTAVTETCRDGVLGTPGDDVHIRMRSVTDLARKRVWRLGVNEVAAHPPRGPRGA